jgi:hypothetical protein
MSRGLPTRTARRQRSEGPGNGRFQQQQGERSKSSSREANPVFGTSFLEGVVQLQFLAMRQELKRVLFEALVVFTVGLYLRSSRMSPLHSGSRSRGIISRFQILREQAPAPIPTSP